MTEAPEDQVRDLERGADEMEEGLGKLEGSLETAHERAAEQRERANPEAAAGDWQEESTAAHQGDDATEASRSPGDEDGGDGGGTAVADAPVHEAEQVGSEGSAEGGADAPVHEAEQVDARGDAEGGGEGADAPVHEAEQVEPEGSGDS
jgi:hypothetical protein